MRGLRFALLLALALAILPSPPTARPDGTPAEQRGAGDVIRAIAGVYRKRSANRQFVTFNRIEGSASREAH